MNAVRTTDDSRQRFKILARLVFTRFKALLVEPSAYVYAERHDNIEAIYRKLSEHIDTTDVTEVLKALHRIVNQAIVTDAPGVDQVEEKQYDLSQINLEKLRDEFAKKVKHKATTLQDIRTIIEARLSRMLMHNPRHMDYYQKYQEIIAEYNQEKERVTIEETFAKLVELAKSLDAEQQRAVKEGLSEDELALFDMLVKDDVSKADRDRLKEASRGLLESMTALVKPMERWTEKEQTQAEVKVFILDHLFAKLPDPPYSRKRRSRPPTVFTITSGSEVRAAHSFRLPPDRRLLSNSNTWRPHCPTTSSVISTDRQTSSKLYCVAWAIKKRTAAGAIQAGRRFLSATLSTGDRISSGL